MIAALILAAGASQRMGRPKQLLEYRGRSLVRHAAEVALASRCRPVCVVVGCGAELVRGEVEAMDVRVVPNPAWPDGMSSSIRAGLLALEQGEPVQAVVLMTCDQPLLRAEVLDRLCAVSEVGIELSHKSLPAAAKFYAGLHVMKQPEGIADVAGFVVLGLFHQVGFLIETVLPGIQILTGSCPHVLPV